MLLTVLLLLCGVHLAGAQTRDITGTVSDSNGQPIAGVSIVIEGTSTFRLTDTAGNYTIPAAKGNVLTFAFIGYTTTPVTVGDGDRIDVTLETSTIGIDEVVVVGYGTMLKRAVTSAISNVSGDKVRDLPVNSVGDALKGKIAGAHFYSTNNTPGADPTIRIRGGSSINRSNDPLILVDGIERDIAGINSNDIASVEVLKDAASSAVYGARASNGVVLITTRRGSANRAPRITFEASWAHQDAERLYEFLNAEEYITYVRKAVSTGPTAANLEKDAYAFSGYNSDRSIYSTRFLKPGESVPAGYKSMQDPLDPSKTLIFQDNSFVDEVFRPALWQNYYVGLDGGSDNISYAASIGYTDDGGAQITAASTPAPTPTSRSTRG